MDSRIADDQLFAETLCCSLTLPLQLLNSAPHAHNGAEMRLRAIATVEDGRGEELDDRGENTQLLCRLEAKLDLVMALCASMVAERSQALKPLPVYWSARGMRVQLPAQMSLPQPLHGIALQAADWLPDPVVLPVHLLAEQVDGNTRQLWLGFAPLGDGLQTVLERHLFRLHRRQVAQSRRER